MVVQRYVSNKMKYHDLLVEDPSLRPLVPETVLFSAENLDKMLKSHPVIFLKPNSDHRGNGILRVHTKEENCCIQYSDNDNTTEVPRSELYDTLAKNISRKYIIQQGLNLARMNGNPFDIRVLMHKPENRWQISGWLARVGQKKNQIVTNIVRGAKPFPLEKALESVTARHPVKIAGELADKCHQIASILGTHFELRILALDMAVDQEGKIWFIEMNSDPMFRKMFRQLGDPEMFRQIITTHKYIIEKYKIEKYK